MAEIVDEPAFRNRAHVFDDRFQAGELLAAKLEEYKSAGNAHLLAIPAGGVQVASVIAERLGLPMDLAITRKIHVPWDREAGFGAVSWDGVVLLNEPLVASLGLTKEEIDRCIAEEKEVISRRMEKFRGARPFPGLKEKIVIVVDDGLASGFSMLATAEALRKSGVGEIIVAVPTAPVSAIKSVKPHVERIFCLNIRSGLLFAVANAYKVWFDLEDEDVVKILKPAG